MNNTNGHIPPFFNNNFMNPLLFSNLLSVPTYQTIQRNNINPPYVLPNDVNMESSGSSSEEEESNDEYIEDYNVTASSKSLVYKEPKLPGSSLETLHPQPQTRSKKPGNRSQVVCNDCDPKNFESNFPSWVPLSIVNSFNSFATQVGSQILSSVTKLLNSSSNVRKRARSTNSDVDSEENDRKRVRRNLPKTVINTLKKWLVDHKENPYPSEEEKQNLLKQTNLSKRQLENWFVNARKRHLKQKNTNLNFIPPHIRQKQQLADILKEKIAHSSSDANLPTNQTNKK